MIWNVRIEAGCLVFNSKEVDEIFSLQRTLSVPLKNIGSVSTEKVSARFFEHLSVAGARFLGKLEDCRYVTSDGIVFLEMHDPNKCITINLNHNRYKKIILEVENKETTAEHLSEAVKSKQENMNVSTWTTQDDKNRS